ncbi:MAG: thioredoxin-dependent thiol peroxidase [Bacteroidales bacterium]|nr:thioredoxin-dependent thiol peroxidase [Bacteroidales bacterium]
MAQLKEGDKAPGFKALDQDGKEVTLASYLGKKVVLYFYPKDDTPGCTAEACDLRDNYNQLLKLGYDVIGVSADNESSHKKFANKHNLPFRLISDTGLSIIKDYGAWGEKNMYGKRYEGILRTTFLIDEVGVIQKIFKKVDTKNHTKQILE